MRRIVKIVVSLMIVLVLLGSTADVCIAGDCKKLNAECELNNSQKQCCPGLVCVPNEPNGKNPGKAWHCAESNPLPPPPIDECVPDGTATCITDCGYEGGTITDNCGNVITCPPTQPCEEPPVDEPTPPPDEPTPPDGPLPPPPLPDKPHKKDNPPVILSVTGVDIE